MHLDKAKKAREEALAYSYAVYAISFLESEGQDVNRGGLMRNCVDGV